MQLARRCGTRNVQRAMCNAQCTMCARRCGRAAQFRGWVVYGRETGWSLSYLNRSDRRDRSVNMQIRGPDDWGQDGNMVGRTGETDRHVLDVLDVLDTRY